jgi:hypothetical protein
VVKVTFGDEYFYLRFQGVTFLNFIILVKVKKAEHIGVSRVCAIFMDEGYYINSPFDKS